MSKLPHLLVLATSLLIAPAAFAGPNHHGQDKGHAKAYRRANGVPQVVVQQPHGHGYSHRYRAAAWGYAPAPTVVVAPRLSWCDGEVSRVIVQMQRRYGVASRLAVLRHAMATHDGWLDGRDLVRLAHAIGPRRGVRDLVATVRPILRPMHPAQVTALLARTHPMHRDEVFAMLGGQTVWHPHHGPTVAQGW